MKPRTPPCRRCASRSDAPNSESSDSLMPVSCAIRYLATLEAKNCSPVRIQNMRAQFNRVCDECRFLRLCDLHGERLTRWLLDRMREGMSAATRNGFRESLVMFANWFKAANSPAAGVESVFQRSQGGREI